MTRIPRHTWPELYEIDPEPRIDPWVLLERQWRHSQRRRSKHDPVYSTEFILESAFNGNPRAPAMVAFNRVFPTRRHHWHACHVMFGVPCNELCKPSRNPDSSVGLIERIKAAYRIEDIAGKHTALRGTHTLHGPCFLHAGSGTEFVIWVDEQRWQCFGRCQIHGDIIDLIRAMKERGIAWMKS